MHSRSQQNAQLKLHKTGRFFFLFLPATIPLLFGAVHPVVQGMYTAAILIGCGGWLLLNTRYVQPDLVKSRWILVFLMFLAWTIFTTIPLPLTMLDFLSPVRAASLIKVNQLAGTDIKFAPLSYNCMAGLRSSLFLFALLIYGLCLRVLLDNDRSFLKALLYTCTGLGVFESVYGMMQVVNPHLGVLWLSGFAAFKGMACGTIIYKNQYASLLNMCWPLAIGAALLFFRKNINTPSKKKNTLHYSVTAQLNTKNLQGILLLFLAGFIMMAVLFSQSRGGTIAMTLILILLFFFLPLQRKKKITLSGSLILLIIVYGSVIGFSSIFERFLNIGESGLNRLTIYTSSLPILYDHWLTGIGLESYQLLSPVYLKNFPENILFDRAHNEYLELAIELGLPMAGFFLAALLTALFLKARQLQRHRKQLVTTLKSSTLIALVCFCTVIGFLVHGIADFGWRLPANLLYAVILVALISHGTRKKKRVSSLQVKTMP